MCVCVWGGCGCVCVHVLPVCHVHEKQLPVENLNLLSIETTAIIQYGILF